MAKSLAQRMGDAVFLMPLQARSVLAKAACDPDLGAAVSRKVAVPTKPQPQGETGCSEENGMRKRGSPGFTALFLFPLVAVCLTRPVPAVRLPISAVNA